MGRQRRKKGKLMGIFTTAVNNTTNIYICCDCNGLTMSRSPTAFWRASARVAASADPPVKTQADRDRDSTRERYDWLKTPVREFTCMHTNFFQQSV